MKNRYKNAHTRTHTYIYKHTYIYTYLYINIYLYHPYIICIVYTYRYDMFFPPSNGSFARRQAS